MAHSDLLEYLDYSNRKGLPLKRIEYLLSQIAYYSFLPHCKNPKTLKFSDFSLDNVAENKKAKPPEIDLTDIKNLKVSNKINFDLFKMKRSKK